MAIELYTTVVLPILYPFSDAESELFLCFDGCYNDLKEYFKSLGLSEDEMRRRIGFRPLAHASNCILTQMVNNIASQIFKEHERRRSDGALLPNLTTAKVTALQGPQEADDVAVEKVYELLRQPGLEYVLLCYVDNDNIASGARCLSTAFQQSKSQTPLLCLTDRAVDSNGNLVATVVDILGICTKKCVHPQLVPLMASLVGHDKSLGCPGIGDAKVWQVAQQATVYLNEQSNKSILEAWEEGMTTDLIKALLLHLSRSDDAIPALVDLTEAKIDEIAAGVMDSVIGYPESFHAGNLYNGMLERSQLGETFLEKEKIAGTVVFTENEDSSRFILLRLDPSKVALLLSKEVRDEMANKIIDIGISKGVYVALPFNVAALCTASGSLQHDYYFRLADSLGQHTLPRPI